MIAVGFNVNGIGHCPVKFHAAFLCVHMEYQLYCTFIRLLFSCLVVVVVAVVVVVV